MQTGAACGLGRRGLCLKVLHNEPFEQRQLPVKKMPARGYDGNWQGLLRARPIEHGSKRHNVIMLAVQHQRVRVQLGADGGGGKTAGCQPHQYHLLQTWRGAGLQDVLGSSTSQESTKRKTSQCNSTTGCGLRNDLQHIGKLATAFVISAAARAYATAVKAHDLPARLQKSACQCLHNLVMHGATVQRVRVGNDGYAVRRNTCRGQLVQRLNGADAALQGKGAGLGVHGKSGSKKG